MAMLTGDKAFSLEQELAIEQQETVDDDLVKETCRQRGLILLTAETEEGRFRRVVEEFLLADEAFSAVQGRDKVGFGELRRLHDEAVADRQVELHVSGGLEVESDLANRGIASPPGPAIAPYDPPDEPIPIPAFVLYWPTITPVLSEAEVEPGEGWAGSVTVQIGAGEFPLTYSVELVEYVEQDPLVRIAIDEQERTAMVGTDGDIALHLKPKGSWTVRISHEDGLWEQGEGEMSFGVRATYKEDEEEDEEVEVEVLKWTNKFSVKRIPVTFDDTGIYPAAWEPETPSAAPAPAHGAGDEAEQPGESPRNGGQ